MIVKMQLPILTNLSQAQALIYNKDKSFMVEVPVHMVEPLFPEDVNKIYAEIEDDLGGDDGKKIVFIDYAENQSW